MTNLSELLTRLDAAATPGPWEAGSFAIYGAGDLVADVEYGERSDAELIVALRNHVPELLAVLAERDEAQRHALTHLRMYEDMRAERDQLRAIVARVEALADDWELWSAYAEAAAGIRAALTGEDQ